MDFNYAGELLKLCEETKLPISEVMKRREMDFFFYDSTGS